MKTLIDLPFLFIFVSCTANAQPAPSIQVLELTGDSLPTIRHITDMKISGDTLYFVYETEEGFGQRFLRSAVIDKENAKLNIRPEIGKREDGCHTSYMPFPFINSDNKIQVINQDDGEIYDLSADNSLTRTNKYLISGNCTVPFQMSQYIQDISMISPYSYIFIGREPNGGSQYAMTADIANENVDTIRRIAISPELKSWMPNAGKLVYSHKYKRLAFGYRLHPVIEIFGIDGQPFGQVRISPDMFDHRTLVEADFEELNPIYIMDISISGNYLWALYWGYKYQDIEKNSSVIYRIDWNGDIISSIRMPGTIWKIAAYGNSLICWDGKNFLITTPPPSHLSATYH